MFQLTKQTPESVRAKNTLSIYLDNWTGQTGEELSNLVIVSTNNELNSNQ